MIAKLTSKMLFFASLLAATSAHAASVTVIHGINGLDLGAAKALPVDIAVNGACSLKGVQFTQSATVTLGRGDYRITVHPADGKCGATPVIDQKITITEKIERDSIAVVASLNEAGNVPRLSVYVNNLVATVVGVRHEAVAPPVFVKISATFFPSQGPTRIRNGGAGATFAQWSESLKYRVAISTGRSSGFLARLSGRIRSSRTLYRYFYVVGSLKNGLEIVTQDVAP